MNQSDKIKASVYIVTLNEEKNLARALESVKAFDEIIVVDSGSTDRTLEIAKQYDARVFHHEWQSMAQQKEYASSLCKHDWVLNIDADEEVDKLLLDEIAQTVLENRIDALNTPFLEFFMGRVSHSRAKHIAKVRFYKKSKARYAGSMVHAGVVIDGCTENAKGFIRHYGEVSIAVKVQKNNLYSSQRAEEKWLKNKKPSVLRLLLVFPFVFFKSFFLRRSFYNGRRGFINSMVNAFYAFLKEAKLYEKTVAKD